MRIVCILLKQAGVLCQQKEEKNLYNFMVFPFWKTRLCFYLQRTFTYIDQNVRKTLCLPPGCQSTTRQLSRQRFQSWASVFELLSQFQPMLAALRLAFIPFQKTAIFT